MLVENTPTESTFMQ